MSIRSYRLRRSLWRRKSRQAVAALALASVLWSTPGSGGTSYESQIGGFIAASLGTLITGEYAGRRPSQVMAPLHRPACKPADFEDLRRAATDKVAFDAIAKRCKLTASTYDDKDVHVTAYLPPGDCEKLKDAFERMLAEHVYASPRPGAHPEDVTFEYKGSFYSGSRRTLARYARLRATCHPDGSLRVSAPRNPRRGI